MYVILNISVSSVLIMWHIITHHGLGDMLARVNSAIWGIFSILQGTSLGAKLNKSVGKAAYSDTNKLSCEACMFFSCIVFIIIRIILIFVFIWEYLVFE